MKKYASILAVFVLLLGIAALSYAAPAEIPSDTTAVIAKGKTQITLGGELRFRGIYGSNLKVKDNHSGSYGYKDIYEWKDSNDDGVVDSGEISSSDSSFTGKNTANYDYRVRLNLEAKVSPNTTGFLELESGTNTTDNVIWGSATGGARGNYVFGNTKDSNVTIRQAWIQYQGSGLLGVPAGVKVGRQLIKLGYGLFFDHTYFGDDAILAFVQPIKELTIAAHTIKFREGNSTSNDDSTAYGILAAYSGKGFGISTDITYVDDQNLAGYLFRKSNGFIYALDNLPSNAASDYINLEGSAIHLWNIGLRGNYDDIAGTGLGFRADVEFQTGKLDMPTGHDPKFKGWAALAGLDYKFKAVPLSLTLEYAIGSGNPEKFDITKDNIKAFITALGQEQHYTFIYEYLAPSACNFGANARTGLCNTQYVKLGGDYDITKDLKAELYGYWLRAHKAVAINSAKDANNNLLTDKDLGWEVDAKVTYKIDKGLTYFVEGGYFWAGDAYKLGKSGDSTNPLRDADDAWAVRHGIQLKF